MNNNTRIRCAIYLCSTLTGADEPLDHYTYLFLKNKGLEIKERVITDYIEKYCIAAKLYGLYKDNIAQIQQVGLVQELYRALWLYYIVANLDGTTPVELLTLVNNKYTEESSIDDQLNRSKFCCFKMVDKEFAKLDDIEDSRKMLAQFSKTYVIALRRLEKTFNELSDYSYMNDLFSLDSADLLLKEQHDKKKTKNKQSNAIINTEIKEEPIKVSERTETQLRDEIRVLKSDKHDLEVKLLYAKKDAIREFLTSLTGYGWNCPLNELYRLVREEDTPERIKGIINNLFMALGDESIKFTRHKVGEVIILNEENQKTFDPFKNEKLYLGDKAEIYYPGYRYDHEIMLRPVVRKIIEEREIAENENG